MKRMDGLCYSTCLRAVPFILRVALPKNAACRAACGVPECSKGAEPVEHLSGAKVLGWVWEGCPLPQGGRSGPPQENFSFESGFQAIWSSYMNL